MFRTRFADDLKSAMKAQDTCRVATLRLILATLKDRDIAVRGDGEQDSVSDEDILEMLAKMVRQRRESVTLYEQSGRDDLAAREAEEISIIEEYMPTPLDAAETEAAVREALAKVDAKSVKDMGRAMAALKADYAGRMDFGKASGLVKQILTGGG
jgi:uncharacterized protein YqeY